MLVTVRWGARVVQTGDEIRLERVETKSVLERAQKRGKEGALSFFREALMKHRVHEATMALVLEYAKRKPSVAEQDRFYAMLEELIGAATTLGALEHEDEKERALLLASGRDW